MPGRPTRSLDTTWRGVLTELLRAIAGLLVAFLATELIASAVGWDHSAGGLAATAAVFVVLGLGALYITSGRPIMLALLHQRTEIAEHEAQLTAAATRHQFAADLQNALDMAETEEEALVVSGRAIGSVATGTGQLLLADSSRAHLRQAVATGDEHPGCSVPTPWSCPAVRRGATLEFPLSSALAACPRLAERGDDLAAVCVPVTILGTPMGVLHMVTATDRPPSPTARAEMETVAVQIGTRVGVLRAMSTSQLAASTDPLTGRLNRRTMEERLRDLQHSSTRFAVAFADLDHFKALNDTHGHAAGDKALRHFARVVTSVVRDQDLVCRYGGEEFVMVFPGCDAQDIVPVVHRIREELATSLTVSGLPHLTASFGLSDSTYAAEPSDVIASADEALLQAKRDGRDRLVVADRPDPGLDSYLASL